MDIKLKGSIILIVLLGSLYYAFPTYRAYQPGVDPQTVENKVNLGLDLQGGMYLDIEIKVDEAVKEILRRTALELEDLLIDEQVDFVEVRQVTNSLILEMEPGKKVNLEIAPYDRFLEQFDMNVQDDLTYLKLKSGEAQLIRENSVSQALEVLRNRIDSLGISEPSLQKQGDDNIVSVDHFSEWNENTYLKCYVKNNDFNNSHTVQVRVEIDDSLGEVLE